MKIYLISLAAGVLVGVIYGLLQVRSPAPPLVALVGLLGILVGEQLPSLARHVWLHQGQSTAWFHEQVKPHMCGELPSSRTRKHRDVTEDTQS